MKMDTRLLLAIVIFIALLLGCAGSEILEIDKSPIDGETPEPPRCASLVELLGSAPANSAPREEWSRWESTYGGRCAEGKGRVDSASVHPQQGKLFFIVTILGQDAVGSTMPQVALLVEDAHYIALGEEEGSFLIDDAKWIQLGDNYAFQGRVSEYSRSYADMVRSGEGVLIVISVMKKDVNLK